MRKLPAGLLLDVGLPAVVYYGAHALGYSIETSLIAAGVGALLRVAYVAIAHRRLDVIAAVVGGTFAIMLAISLLTNDPRVLLAKESVVSGVAGVLLVGSCLVGRPLVYVLARKFKTAPDWDDRWQHERAFRRRFTTLSLIFGGVLLVDALGRLVLILALPVDTMANLSPVLHLATLALLGGAGLWLRSHRRAPEQTPAQ
ncbi:MAG: hypothetical protein HOV67_12035 [Kribbellaceae bacterium]|nr:hypothetical protein [Kribbellaceae bacterium]